MITWIDEELKGLDLGDSRLNSRMASLLTNMSQKPTLSIPGACKGRVEAQAAYRFCANDKVTFDAVLAPHIQSSRERVSKAERVLLVQDTTEIDLQWHELKVEGVGELRPGVDGVLAHMLHAFTADGTPLGTVHAEIINRTQGLSTDSPEVKTAKRKLKPIEDKESFRWLTAVRQAREISNANPDVECICMGDSESDVYEILAEPRGEINPLHLIVRACQDRALLNDEDQTLRKSLMKSELLYEAKVHVRARTSLIKSEKQTRKMSREERDVVLEVRSKEVELRPPQRNGKKLEPVKINAVMVSEPNPVEGESSIEWILLTTLPIDTPEAVRKVVESYSGRWNIEIFFRVLKSGCRIEDRRFEHIDRFLPCLAMYMIVAWRIYFVTKIGRECPEMCCEIVFEPSEWKAVWKVMKRTDPPKKPPKLQTIVHLVAELGGWIARKTSHPGPQVMWIGIQRMHDFATGWEIFGPEAKKSRR